MTTYIIDDFTPQLLLEQLLCVRYDSYPEFRSSDQALLGIYILGIIVKWQLRADIVPSCSVTLSAPTQPSDQHVAGNSCIII